MRVGINGFGRIGRAIYRINAMRKLFDIVAINDLDPDINNFAYLLKYDTTYGRMQDTPVVDDSRRTMTLGDQETFFHAHAKTTDVPWEDYGVDIVIDASGVHQNVIDSHLLIAEGRAKKVLITHSPKKDVDYTVVFGVNEHGYDPSAHDVVSTSICDVVASAPALKILDDAFGVDHGYITTLHPWLAYQNVLDGTVRSVSSPGHFWGDYSLGRNSTDSLIPKNTTVVAALDQVVPEIASRLDAISFRVPTSIVSASDMTISLQKKTSVEELKELFQAQAKNNSKVIGYEEDHLVSIDFKGVDQSLFVDGRWLRVNPSGSVKIIVWYDNEWGYSQRVVDMAQLVFSKLQ